MREVIAVIRGGPSSEYDVSLKSGANVLAALNRERYEPRDIFIDKAGQWHVFGAPVTPERALRDTSVALNVVHGEFGEDGRLQKILEKLAVPYSGPNAAVAALAFDKQRTKDAAAQLGLKVAHGTVVDSTKISDIDKTAFNLFRSMPHPMIIKPVVGGSSVGMTKVEHFDMLAGALQKAFEVSPQALVEEFISGREATVGVIDNFRGEKLYALMPVEIIPPPHRPFFDYEAKYSGETLERVPGHFSREDKNHLMTAARLVHQGLNLPHYSRSDFIVSKRGIYFLEVNPVPAIGMTNESLFPKALQAVGASLSNFLEHVIHLARRRQM